MRVRVGDAPQAVEAVLPERLVHEPQGLGRMAEGDGGEQGGSGGMEARGDHEMGFLRGRGGGVSKG